MCKDQRENLQTIDKYKITKVMKVEADFITSIKESDRMSCITSDKVKVETFKTSIIVSIDNIILVFNVTLIDNFQNQSQSIDTGNIHQ